MTILQMAESERSAGTTPTVDSATAMHETPMLKVDNFRGEGEGMAVLPPPEPVLENTNETCSAFVRMLYPELAAEIFSLAVAGSWLPYCHKHKAQSAATRWVGPVRPSSLLSVCRSWQRIALTHPPLWTSLLLTVGANAEDRRGDLEERLRRLEGQISKTGTSLLLSIRLQQKGGHFSDHEVKEIFVPLIQLLAKYADRWEAIDCRLQEEFQPLFISKTQIYPSLTSLYIKSTGGFPNPVLDLNNSTPSLTHISLSRFYFHSIHLPQPPLALVKLDLKQFYPDECLAAIGYCANTLVHLCLRSVAKGDDNHPLPTKPIIAPRVQTCDIYASSRGGDRIPLLLAHFVCPNIRRFRYTDTRGTTTDGSLAALQFFTNCLGPSHHQWPASEAGLVKNHHADNASLHDHHTHRHHHRHHSILAMIHDVLLTEEDLFRLWSARSDVTVFGFLREPVDTSRPILDVEVDILDPWRNGRVPSFDIDAKSVNSVGSYWRDYLGDATHLLPALEGH